MRRRTFSVDFFLVQITLTVALMVNSHQGEIRIVTHASLKEHLKCGYYNKFNLCILYDIIKSFFPFSLLDQRSDRIIMPKQTCLSTAIEDVCPYSYLKLSHSLISCPQFLCL